MIQEKIGRNTWNDIPAIAFVAIYPLRRGFRESGFQPSAVAFDYTSSDKQKNA